MQFKLYFLPLLAGILALITPSGSMAQQPDTLAGIRIVSVHPWAPPTDIYISGNGTDSLMMEGLGYLEATHMHRGPEGNYDITATVTGQPNVVLTEGTMQTFQGQEKTVFALAPTPLEIQMLPLVRETGMTIPAGKAMIRIVQGSTISPVVSVHIIDSSGASGHFMEMEFADTVDYREMAPGGFTVLVVDEDVILFQGRAGIDSGMAGTLIISNDMNQQVCHASLLIDTDTSRQQPMIRLLPLSSVPEPARLASRLNVAPNPAKDRSVLPFHLPSSGHVQVLLHDAAGQLVSTLADEFMERGDHTQEFSVEGLPAGTYLLRVLRDGKEVIGEGKVTVVR